jgi:protein-S-isoprenylcysteine O-methyltransferase Ste14
MIPCALYIRKIIEREEIFMGKYFGDEWEEYKERVTRFFIIV